MDPLLSIEGLTVGFRQNGRVVPVVHGIDLAIARGESVGVVGESGCGKSVTWLAALGLLGKRTSTGGRVMLGETDLLTLDERALARVRGKKIALIFQDPTSALNPVHRIGRQIGEALILHRGMSQTAARAQTRRLLDQVGIADAARRVEQYPHELSGGMNQRVMIATALAGEPDLLVADEPTTALDATIQAQILDLIRAIQKEHGMALVLISHDLGIVSDLCERIVVMYAGRVVETSPADALFDGPRHPYTAGLLGALPELDGPRQRLVAIPGNVPSPAALPPGCAFAPRCPRMQADCLGSVPPLASIAHGHMVACRHPLPQSAMPADAWARSQRESVPA